MRLSTLSRTLVGIAMVLLFACTQKAATTETTAPAEEITATDTANPSEAVEEATAPAEETAPEGTEAETN